MFVFSFILAACGAPTDDTTSAPDAAAQPTPTTQPTPQPAIQSPATNPIGAGDPPTPALPTAPPAQASLDPAAPRVLAWNPNAAVLAWYAPSGKPDELSGASPRALAIPCLQAGDRLALHLGGERAGAQDIYSLAGEKPLALGQNNGLACALRGGFQLSRDGRWLGLLRYAPDAVSKKFAVGTLRILSLPSGTEQFTLDDVAAFHLSDSGAATLQFYANDQGEARVADLRWWDGSALRPLEQDIQPLEGCFFVSGRVLRRNDQVFTLFGERCARRGSSWRLMRTDLAGGNSVNLATGQTGGAYFTNSGSNLLWALPGRDQLLIGYPNGLSSDVANLARVDLADNRVIPVIEAVVVDFHPPSLPRRLLPSPDGLRLAMVKRDGNGAERLLIYDLDSPDTPPEVVAGGGRNDRIPALAWSSDGSRLYYIATGEVNALYYLVVQEKTKRLLILRGVFQGLVLSLDGAMLATSEQVQAAANDVRNHLVLINVAEQRSTLLVEGARGESALVPLAVR